MHNFQVSLDHAPRLVIACMKIHNFIIDNKCDEDMEALEDDDLPKLWRKETFRCMIGINERRSMSLQVEIPPVAALDKMRRRALIELIECSHNSERGDVTADI